MLENENKRTDLLNIHIRTIIIDLYLVKEKNNFVELLCMIHLYVHVLEGVGVLSSKTLSSSALSSKEHWSNGTLVERNIGRTEHSSNGAFV